LPSAGQTFVRPTGSPSQANVQFSPQVQSQPRRGTSSNPMPGRSRIYIVHTQLVVEESLRLALEQEPEVEIVASQVDTDSVEERVLLSHASILLLDGSIDADRLIRIISTVSAVVRVIVLAQKDEADLLVRCMAAGAAGYLSGPRGLIEIGSAVRQARDGWVVLTPEQIAAFFSGSRMRRLDPAAAALCASLSAREQDVLRSFAAGASVSATASHLGISDHTVQTHLKIAMRRLNVRTRLAAVVMALRAGLLDETDT
jgi:DNA-binding NarL/FixJ family response regulator